MALKPTRITTHGGDSIAQFMNQVAERGGIVVWASGATGNLGNLDDPNAVVVLPVAGSGNVPVGVLMNDVVNLDLTRTHLNQHRDEVQVNGKVAVLKHGTVHTDQVLGGDAPVPGNPAYYTAGGLFTTQVGLGSPQVGTFTSALDADGYVVVDIRL